MSKKPSKRGLTLDLAAPTTSSKRARVSATPSVVANAAGAVPGAAGGAQPPVLTTPDVQMLKLSSPEMAKFLSASSGLPTPTPSGYAFPKTVSEEQELYAKGFEEALKKVAHEDKKKTAIDTIEKATAAHNTRNQARMKEVAVAAAAAAAPAPASVPAPVPAPPAAAPTTVTTTGVDKEPSRPSSTASGSIDSDTNSSLNFPEGVCIKEEEDDDDFDDANGLAPIDMVSQERIKLERKRQRNRVAASKCRRKKLERISQLEGKVQQLKGDNAELAGVVKKLKADVYNLKQEVIQHVNNGCPIALNGVAGF